jgi:signal transduction histidine kinase/ActR/RegA family two-component response regulator
MIWIAAALNRADEKRCLAEQSVRDLNEDLERRVEERTAELAKRDEQLRQAQKMEAIGTLAGGIAHEFNNLSQAIQGYTRYVMDEFAENDRRRQDLEEVLHASYRAAALTRQLLGFSRRQVLELVDLDPNLLVRELVKMIRPLIGENIKVESDLGADVGFVHADEGHLQQLLMNLCVNARDAMPQGGQLTIRTESVTLSEDYCSAHRDVEPGRYLMLTVADDGCGMPAEVRDHIFEPFFTTKGVGKGTGLGLAMVYGILQQHHGAIRVYSEPGMGTTFRIYLPAIGRQAPDEAEPMRQRARGGTETILIAEDEPMVRQLTVRILQSAGYHTLVAANGEEAVRLFEEHIDEVDLAVLDVVMPRMGGRDAFQKIRVMRPEVQAIFCSGYDPDTAQVGFVADQRMRLIQKPFDPQLLLATVREVLDECLCVATP